MGVRFGRDGNLWIVSGLLCLLSTWHSGGRETGRCVLVWICGWLGGLCELLVNEILSQKDRIELQEQMNNVVLKASIDDYRDRDRYVKPKADQP
jgi:hypothetical protein